MLRKLFAGLLLLLLQGVAVWGDDVSPEPKLLLNAARLRRLKRDRERKTARWVSFENRVLNVPDSPERGFELALYYAITGDETKGREAVDWAIRHKSIRQAALAMDWCAPLLGAEQKSRLQAVGMVAANGSLLQNHFVDWRDAAFMRIALNGTPDPLPDESSMKKELAWWIKTGLEQPEQLYALCEFVYAARAMTRRDLREGDAHFFATLPEIVLLSVKPGQLGSPPWLLHAAALALVALDPNLPSSQFLQSWALEDAQTLREGPGVAYELLWADPYLPGVGYQNMDLWAYDDDHGQLFARASWQPDSCWIAISAQGVEQQNCPPNWQLETVTFGHLTLIPMTERCVDLPHIANRLDTVLVWKLKPGESITHGKGKDAHSSSADAAGIWRPGSNLEGKACASGH